MTKTDQRINSVHGGDCFAACLASILEAPLNALPNFHGDYWWSQWEDWLQPLNLTMVIVSIPEKQPDRDLFIACRMRGYTILGVKSPFFESLHAVVAKDGRMVWDPNNSNRVTPGGVVDLKYNRLGFIPIPEDNWVDCTFLTVLDPSQPVLVWNWLNDPDCNIQQPGRDTTPDSMWMERKETT